VKRCPVCGKDKSEFEMRPIVNAEELAMGDAVSDGDSKEDVGGAKLHVVCRSCWLALLETRSKEEIVELLETISGILFEIARAQAQAPSMSEIIEKAQKMPMVPSPSQPLQPHIYPTFPSGGLPWWGTGSGSDQFLPKDGQWANGTKVDLHSGSSTGNLRAHNCTTNLAEQFGTLMFGEDYHLGVDWAVEGDDDAGEPVPSE